MSTLVQASWRELNEKPVLYQAAQASFVKPQAVEQGSQMAQTSAACGCVRCCVSHPNV